MSRSRKSRRSDGVASPLALLAELRPAVEALRRALAALRVGSPLHEAASGVHAGLDRLAAALGHPGHYAATDHLNAHRLTCPVAPARSEPPAMPSMPERSLYDVVEEDEGGTFAVVWAATGRIVVWNGASQSGLAIDAADDAADHLEALDRIAEGRRAGRLYG